MYEYKARVDRIVDGDTLYATVDLGFHTYQRLSFRLARVNTPEIRGPERPAGMRSKEFVQRLLPVGLGIVIRTTKTGKYGRWIAEVIFDMNGEPINLSDLLMAEGMGVPYGK